MKYYDYVDDFNVYSSVAKKYDKRKKKLMKMIIILFAIFLIIGALSFLYFFANGFSNKPYIKNDELSITFQSSDSGSTIDNLLKYDSLENSYSYSFYIENKSSNNVKYLIYLNSNYNVSGNVHYVLYKNDTIIYSGLINQNSILLESNKLLVGKNNNYIIKFFTNDYNDVFDFKINVKSGE